MFRSIACLTALVTLVAVSAAHGQSHSDMNAHSLVNRETAIDKRLDNEVKKVETHFARRLANIQGRADVRVATMEHQKRVLAAEIDHLKTYGPLREQERQIRD